MSERQPNEPTAPRTGSNLPTVAFVIGILAVVGLSAIIWSGASVNQEEEQPPGPMRPKPNARAPKWEVVSAEDAVVDSFMRKRNAADREAGNLLGRQPANAGGGVLTPGEAESLETDYFLREILKIVEIRGTAVVGQFVLLTTGNVSAPRLAVRLKNGELSTGQRTMTNPDLFVEVRDGKIYGVRAALHHD